MSKISIQFDDVEKCLSIKDFNDFCELYFKEHFELTKDEKNKHYWALFYRWKEARNYE